MHKQTHWRSQRGSADGAPVNWRYFTERCLTADWKSRHRRQCKHGRRVLLPACENRLYFRNGCIVTDRNCPFRGNVNFYERHRDRMCFIRVLSLLVRLINEKLQPQCWVELLSWAVCVEFTRVLERDLDRSGVVSPPSLPACCMFAAEPEVCSCAVSWKIKRFQHLLRVNSCDYAVGLFFFFFLPSFQSWPADESHFFMPVSYDQAATFRAGCGVCLKCGR